MGAEDSPQLPFGHGRPSGPCPECRGETLEGVRGAQHAPEPYGEWSASGNGATGGWAAERRASSQKQGPRPPPLTAHAQHAPSPASARCVPGLKVRAPGPTVCPHMPLTVRLQAGAYGELWYPSQTAWPSVLPSRSRAALVHTAAPSPRGARTCLGLRPSCVAVTKQRDTEMGQQSLLFQVRGSLEPDGRGDALERRRCHLPCPHRSTTLRSLRASCPATASCPPTSNGSSLRTGAGSTS